MFKSYKAIRIIERRRVNPFKEIICTENYDEYRNDVEGRHPDFILDEKEYVFLKKVLYPYYKKKWSY